MKLRDVHTNVRHIDNLWKTIVWGRYITIQIWQILINLCSRLPHKSILLTVEMTGEKWIHDSASVFSLKKKMFSSSQHFPRVGALLCGVDDKNSIVHCSGACSPSLESLQELFSGKLLYMKCHPWCDLSCGFFHNFVSNVDLITVPGLPVLKFCSDEILWAFVF